MKFTKLIKEKWLKALKSGKYTPTAGQLKREKGYCCLGVLVKVIPELTISKSGSTCVLKETKEDVNYIPFNEMFGNEMTTKLYGTNDRFIRNGATDYSGVIPLIEKLPTED